MSNISTEDILASTMTEKLRQMYVGIHVTSATKSMKQSEKGRFRISAVSFAFQERTFYEEHCEYNISSYLIQMRVESSKSSTVLEFEDIKDLPVLTLD